MGTPKRETCFNLLKTWARSFLSSLDVGGGVDQLSGVRASGRRGCCCLPWNFPIAIPCGGIAAALATGNVILASVQYRVVAHLLASALSRGVPREALHCRASVWWASRATMTAIP